MFFSVPLNYTIVICRLKFDKQLMTIVKYAKGHAIFASGTTFAFLKQCGSTTLHHRCLKT